MSGTVPTSKAGHRGTEPHGGRQAVGVEDAQFRGEFEALFVQELPRLFRFLDRLSGDPDLAADTAQEALSRLLRRGSMPDSPPAWLFTVALNLLRNAEVARSRRFRLLSGFRGRHALADPPPAPDRGAGAQQTRARVRAALDTLGDRDRKLLLLRAEGMTYREMAETLGLNEASVGTLLARAKKAFRNAYEGESDAS